MVSLFRASFIDFLRYGWLINYQSDILASSSFRHHPSAVKNSEYLSTYIAKELSHQSALGPFRCNPFNTDGVISALLCVLKRDSVELRDHSFPEGSSVNDGISSDQFLEQFFKLRLPGIDCLVEFVNTKGRGCHVFTKDPRCAYREIPIDPQDYTLLGLSIDGSLLFHTALPFGLRSATKIFQRTTKSVAYILNSEGISVDVYIDDFYGAKFSVHLNSPFSG